MKPHSFWEISPASNPTDEGAYGRIVDVSDWPNARDFDEYLPVSLFMGDFASPWQEIMEDIAGWNDFIWGDDDVPWVTAAAMHILQSSGLTGFQFEPIVVVEVGQTSLEAANIAELPRLFRVGVPHEFQERQLYSLTQDYASVLGNSRRLLVSERAMAWLKQSGWTNFQLKPLA